MNKRTLQLIDRLRESGFTFEDAIKLRRIEMTLARWGELECGDGNDYQSWAIERDETTGKPFMVTHNHKSNNMRKYPVRDREKGALRRLERIMSAYPDWTACYQTDPRGCALYVVRKDDLKGLNIESCYTRGIAVCD